MSAPWWDDDYNGRTPEYRAYVGNLSWRTDERLLQDAFANYDPIDTRVSGLLRFGWICACFLLGLDQFSRIVVLFTSVRSVVARVPPPLCSLVLCLHLSLFFEQVYVCSVVL